MLTYLLTRSPFFRVTPRKNGGLAEEKERASHQLSLNPRHAIYDPRARWPRQSNTTLTPLLSKSPFFRAA
jgi:hypothetical protein